MNNNFQQLLSQILGIQGGLPTDQMFTPQVNTYMPTMPSTPVFMPQRVQITPRQHAQQVQATSQAIHNGADPNLLAQAQQYLGHNDYIGLCEAFVEKMTKGAEGLFSSAINAWNQHANKQTDLSRIQPGDALYFAADNSNGGYGHTGVYMGNNKFVSATYNGIKQSDLNDWQHQTGQRLLGYIPKKSF